MLGYHFLKPIYFAAAKPATVLQANRIEPKLRDTLVTFDVDMRRLVSISCIEKEPIWSDSEHRRHQPRL
jgi:hypothetical protein